MTTISAAKLRIIFGIRHIIRYKKCEFTVNFRTFAPEMKKLIFNTTYSMPVSDARNFVIWVQETMLPAIEQDGVLDEPRLLRVLSHHDEQTECFSLQLSVPNSAILHKWLLRQGQPLAEEMKRVFDDRIAGFSTLMEEV